MKCDNKELYSLLALFGAEIIDLGVVIPKEITNEERTALYLSFNEKAIKYIEEKYKKIQEEGMKKISKKVLSVVLCIVMLMSTFVIGITASAVIVSSGICGAYLTWKLGDEGTLTISGTGDMFDFDFDESPWHDSRASIKNVVIGPGVTSIGTSAFYFCSSLESITIPEGVTSIGDYVFEYCTSLESITIPEGVTSIGYGTFEDCSSLTSITIPNSVKSIGDWAFSCCSSLTSITVDKDNTIYDSRNNCNAIIETATNKLIAGCKNTIIPEDVTSIGGYAFNGCTGLTSITIPEGVTSIGFCAFNGCLSLTSITIPKGVTSIDYGAFADCSSLANITIPEGVTSIGERAFANCTSLTSITIPEGVTSIGERAFANCTSLTSITIPEGVTSIGDFAFEYCKSLTSITIPEGVTSIGYDAFSDCTGLTSITISDSVTSIGDYAFSSSRLVVFCNKNSYTHTYCSTNSVDYVLLDDDTDRYITGSLGIKLTWSIDKLQRTLTINCNGNMPSFSSNSAPWKEYSKYFITATIEDGCTSIGDSAFEYCSSLTSITIPDSVTSIGDVFEYCESLTNITIPDSVTSIDSYAFYGCESLTEIEIPYSVKTIGSSAFSNCSALDKIYIYNRNCSIDSSAIPFNATIYGFTGSTAETFADENGYYFVAIDDTHEHTFNDDDICKLCGYDNRHDHNWSEWTVTIENNCTEDGEKYRICSICSQKETEVIEATGHSEAEAVKENEIKATCTEDGSYDEVVYCLTCSVELSRDTIIIPAIGHTSSEAVKENETKATCTEAGSYESVVYCLTCSVELCRDTIIIPALGHTSSEAVKENETKATCTEDGNYDSVVYCTVCKEIISSEAKVAPATGHSYTAKVTKAATCIAAGTKTYTCTVCGDKYNETIKATGHKDTNKDGYCDVCKTVTDANLVNPCKNAKINVASAKSVDYKAQVTIKATANGVPTGYSLAMYVNGKQVAKGSNTEVTYTVGQATSDINYTVKVIDAKGNVQKDSANKDLAKDGGKITVNSSFFAKIIAFFKSLFGSLSKVEVKP